MREVELGRPASRSVIALVNGLLAPDVWRRILVVQAFIDDSSQLGRVAVLAGYISSVENWVKFSDEWQSLLCMRPRWRRFKMSEIMRNGGNENIERAMFHYRIIERYVDYGVCIAVPYSPFKKVAKEFKIRSDFTNPYYMAWQSMITLLRTHIGPKYPDDTIDIILDKQSESKNVSAAWGVLEDNYPEELKPFKDAPIHRSDDDFLPLQAADLCAWWIRERYVKYGSIINASFPFPWEQNTPGPDYIYAELNECSIREHFVRSYKKT